MPEQETSQLQVPEEGLRPVILADSGTLRDRDAFLRHCFVGLADESCKATLLCPAAAKLGQVAAAPVEVIHYPPLMGLGLWEPILSPLLEKLARIEPTVLHCASEGRLHLTQRLSVLLDVPFVVSVDSVEKSIWHRCCKGKFAGMITPSETLARKIKQDMPAKADLVKSVKVGTFVSEKAACFSTDGSVATMVIVQSLDDVRDFEALFSAIKHLAIDGQEIVVALMGSGRAEHKIRRMIADLSLGHIINIVPEVRPLRPVLSAADIFIKPKRSKSFDFYLLDAMGEGLAIAACRGDEGELIREGQTATVFEEGNEVSIYCSLGTLLREREYAKRLAKGAQDLLLAEYRVSRMVTEMIGVYRQAMARWKK